MFQVVFKVSTVVIIITFAIGFFTVSNYILTDNVHGILMADSTMIELNESRYDNDDAKSTKSHLDGWSEAWDMKKVQDVELRIVVAIARIDVYRRIYDGINMIVGGTEMPNLLCCILYDNGTLEDNIDAINLKFSRSPFMNFTANEYHCPLPGNTTNTARITMRLNGSSCPSLNDYMPVYYPPFADGQIAICTKISYGTVNTDLLIQWFEMQNIIGVDKIVTFTKDDFYEEGKIVLKYYQDKGFLHSDPFALVRTKRHSFSHLCPHYLKESDMADRHCFLAMRGYTYAGIMDYDEIVIPKNYTSLKDSLRKLFEMYPYAAGFLMNQEMFVKNINKTSTLRKRGLADFLYRTRPLRTRGKAIYANNRTSSAHTHIFGASTGYKVVRISPTLMNFHHYRNCPPYLSCAREPLYYDDDISEYAPELKKRLQELPDYIQKVR